MGLAICSPQSGIGRLVVREAVSVPAGTSIRETAQALRRANVSSALVDDGRGIVTERDLTRAWAGGMCGEDAVDALASRRPVVVAEDMPIHEAAAVMLNREVRHLIVLMPDGSSGVVSLREVMAVLLQAVNPEIWLAALKVSFNAPAELWLG